LKRLLGSALLLFLLSCEVRQPDGRKSPPPVPKEKLSPTIGSVIVVKPPEPIKLPKTSGIPEDELGEAMAYSLPNASGLFVIDVKRLNESAMLVPVISQISSLLNSNPAWYELVSKPGLNPLSDIRGVVLSFRQPVGLGTEILIAMVGKFDSVAVAKAVHESTTRGDNDAESISSSLLILGKTSLLTEAKLAASRGALVDAPLMLAALSTVDTSRSVFGAFFPTATSRATGSPSERAKQVTVEFDASTDFLIKSVFLFETAKEAEDAKVELEDGLKQMSPMLGVLGIPDTSKFMKSFVLKVDATQLSILCSIDRATATSMIAGIAGFTKGMVPSTPPTPPTPMPVLTPG
jgi:hypothetical protein